MSLSELYPLLVPQFFILRPDSCRTDALEAGAVWQCLRWCLPRRALLSSQPSKPSHEERLQVTRLQVFLGNVRGACDAGLILGPQNNLRHALFFRIKLKQDFQLGFFFGSRFILKPLFF